MLKTIGLAYRAKMVAYGSQMSLNAIRNKSAKLIIIAKDSANNTIKLITDKCKFYKVDYIFIDSSDDLSLAIGKPKIKVIAILDEGFKKLLL